MGVFFGASPNLHFYTLPGTQIYTTHIYTKAKFTQHQIYTGPIFTRTHIYTSSNLHNPILHKPNIHSHKITSNPNFHSPKFTQIPILHNQRTHFFPSLFLAVQILSPGPNCLGFFYCSNGLLVLNNLVGIFLKDY